MQLSRLVVACALAIGCLYSSARGQDDADAQRQKDIRVLTDLLEKQIELLNRLQSEVAALKSTAQGKQQGDPLLADRRGEEGYRALYTINRDGTDVELLVAAPGMISTATPEWSHDGKMIACDAVPTVDAVTESRVFVYAVDGPFRGTAKELGYGNVPSWSPDDRRIAFMLNDTNPVNAQGGIWIMNADGSDRKWLCKGWYPRWSPDGKEICFHDHTRQRLGFFNVATGEERTILGDDIAVEFGGATWSPDGKRVVLIGNVEGRQQLLTINADGDRDSIKVLYRENDPNGRLVGPPSWSPDGKQIILAVQDADQFGGPSRMWVGTHLYSLSAEVPSAPALLEREKAGVINRGMMWSPDSRKIVFSGER